MKWRGHTGERAKFNDRYPYVVFDTRALPDDVLEQFDNYTEALTYATALRLGGYKPNLWKWDTFKQQWDTYILLRGEKHEQSDYD